MTEHVKFYQVGSFAVGNRLRLDIASVQSDPQRANALTSGHRACQGCGEALGARYAPRRRHAGDRWEHGGGQRHRLLPGGVLHPYPQTSWQIPWLHSLFGNAPAVASGRRGDAGEGTPEVRVVAQGGDGGTTDIGMGALSGMFERNDDVLYICYDNEGLHEHRRPALRRHPADRPDDDHQAVGADPGQPFGQGKDMPRIAMAHDLPYVATATVADLHDLEAKATTAMSIRGARYLHVLVPCPLGWGSRSNETIQLARLATRAGCSRSSRRATESLRPSPRSATRCR